MSKLVFLDTEYSSAGELAQLAYILWEDGAARCRNFYFRVSEMDEGARRVNGLSREWLDAHGQPTDAAREEVLRDFAGATLVAHNLNADKRVLSGAFGPLPNAHGLCTMYRFARVLRLPGGRPYKMPSLRELMAHYGIAEAEVCAQTARDFAQDCAAHDARWDAEAVRLCAAAAMRAGDCRDLMGKRKGETTDERALDD